MPAACRSSRRWVGWGGKKIKKGVKNLTEGGKQ
jgi:hypothetical protein